jgi:tetratricopeptide (TPR) repeat protein
MLERQGLPDALIWRRKVIEHANDATNQLALAATAVKFEPPPSSTAGRILGELTGTATNSSQFHIVSAQFESRAGNLITAENHYLAALQQEPTNSEVELALALTRLQMRDPAKVILGETALHSLSEQTNLTIRALRPLVVVAANRGDFAAALESSRLILANDASTFDDRLTHLDVLTRQRDPASERFRTTLQEQIAANPLYVAQLGGWMTAHQQAQATLAWFRQLPPAIQRSDLVLLATADAYAAEEDWTGLEQFLLLERIKTADQPGWGTIEFVRQALLARAYKGIGQRRAFADSFKGAKDLASGMAARLTSLTRLVATWSWDNEVDDLLWTVFERFPNEAWAADSLLKRYHERKNTDGIRRVFALQLKRAPNDVLLKNNLAMILLLRGEDLPTAHRLALESHRESPSSSINTSTYAFSLLVQGRPTEGRKVMETLDPKILEVPSIAAYYAILTAATDDLKTAGAYVSLAKQADLLPEERALLEAVKKRL